MFVYKDKNGSWEPWNGQIVNGLRHPTNIVTIEKDEAVLNGLGLFKIDGTQPQLKFYERITASRIEEVDGAPKVVYDTEAISLPEAKEMLYEQLDFVRWKQSQDGFSFDLGDPVGVVKLPSDDKMKVNIQGAKDLLIEDGAITSIKWRLDKKTSMPVNLPLVNAMRLELGRHVQACFSRQDELIAAINAATTLQELESIDLNSGWPE